MMRLIDADALRESIITRQTEMSYEDAWALTCVDNAPTIEPQEWVSCSERLPDVGQKVLASTNKTCFTQVFKGTSGASNSSWRWEKNTIKHIFAWRPLPEPWKEDKEC